MEDKDLHALFEKFGTITSAKIMVDEQGQSRGFGFVCFSIVEEATNAIKEMNGKTVDGQQMYVAEAQTKAARQAELSRLRMATLGLGGIGPPFSQVNPGMMQPSGVWPNMYGTQSGGDYANRGRGRGTGGIMRGNRGGRTMTGRARTSVKPLLFSG